MLVHIYMFTLGKYETVTKEYRTKAKMNLVSVPLLSLSRAA